MSVIDREPRRTPEDLKLETVCNLLNAANALDLCPDSTASQADLHEFSEAARAFFQAHKANLQANAALQAARSESFKVVQAADIRSIQYQMARDARLAAIVLAPAGVFEQTYADLHAQQKWATAVCRSMQEAWRNSGYASSGPAFDAMNESTLNASELARKLVEASKPLLESLDRIPDIALLRQQTESGQTDANAAQASLKVLQDRARQTDNALRAKSAGIDPLIVSFRALLCNQLSAALVELARKSDKASRALQLAMQTMAMEIADTSSAG